MFMNKEMKANVLSWVFSSTSLHWPFWKAMMTDDNKRIWNKPFLKVTLLVRDLVPVMILNLIAFLHIEEEICQKWKGCICIAKNNHAILPNSKRRKTHFL